MRFRGVAMLLAGLSGPALAADCPNPAEWAKPEHHQAGRSPDMKFGLKTGTAHELGLLGQDQVKFATGGVARKGFAGVAAIDVPRAGMLIVVVSNRTFVDLIRDGKALHLAGEPAHPDCPGVRKALMFAVTPGRHLVQLSGSENQTIKLATILN